MTKSENGSNQLQFQKLWQELRAINLWDPTILLKQSRGRRDVDECAKLLSSSSP
jgi:hypothetical protein